MFYTKTAKVTAGLVFASGVLSVLLGIAAITGIGDPEIFRLTGITGKALDFGVFTIVFALALGVLAEISQSLADIARGRK